MVEFCGFPCSLDIGKGRRLPYVVFGKMQVSRYRFRCVVVVFLYVKTVFSETITLASPCFILFLIPSFLDFVQYPAILNSHLVNDPYIAPVRGKKYQDGLYSAKKFICKQAGLRKMNYWNCFKWVFVYFLFQIVSNLVFTGFNRNNWEELDMRFELACGRKFSGEQ